MTQLLNPKPPPPFFAHDEPKAAAVMRKKRRRRGPAAAVRYDSGDGAGRQRRYGMTAAARKK